MPANFVLYFYCSKGSTYRTDTCQLLGKVLSTKFDNQLTVTDRSRILEKLRNCLNETNETILLPSGISQSPPESFKIIFRLHNYEVEL